MRIGLRDLQGQGPWFFKLRLVKGGPWVRGMLLLDHSQPERRAARLYFLNDGPAEDAETIEKIIQYGREIDRDEYETLSRLNAPKERSSLAEMEPLF